MTEALKLALETLESSRVFVMSREMIKQPEGADWYDNRITAIREALAQPEQEATCPECKAAVLYECVACSSNNYPPVPAQRQWVGLTEDEINACDPSEECWGLHKIARAIEAKLKEKNA